MTMFPCNECAKIIIQVCSLNFLFYCGGGGLIDLNFKELL